jgi:polyisoprenoid-binding protein YceI
MRSTTIALLLILAGSTTASARPFDFKDPKTLNTVVLVMDSPLEPMVATATGVSGVLDFEPSRPAATRGKILVEARSVQFSNPGLTATAQGPDGLDVERFPTIDLAVKELKNVRRLAPDRWTAQVVSDLTCRGVTRPITFEATATYLAGRAMERHRSGGDLLVVRSTFKIRRRDFGVVPRKGDDLLAEEIEVRLGIAGASP